MQKLDFMKKQLNLVMGKRLITLASAFLFAANSFSQLGSSGKAISHMPEQANGFLIFEEVRNPNVAEWLVEYSTQSYDTVTNKYTYAVVERLAVYGTYFTKVKDQYLHNGNYFVKVVGQNAQNVTIVEEGPLQLCVGCTSATKSCSWGCIGKTYAYGLDLWVAPSGGNSWLQFTSIQPSPGGAYQYYYEWIDGSNWPPSGVSATYYGLSNFSYSSNDNRIIRMLNVQPNNGLFYDKNGYECQGVVYGIRKQLGEWESTGANLQSNIITGGQSNCTQNFNWAKNKVNSNSTQFTNYNVNLLSCDGNEFLPGSTNPFPNENPIATDFVPCIEVFEDAFTGPEGNLYVVLSQTGDLCNDYSSPTNPNPVQNVAFTWPDNVIAFSFKPLKPTVGNEMFELKEDDLFNQEGEFVGPPLSFQRGLYNVGIQFTDNSYSSVFFERDEIISSNLTQEDFLNVSIFPVPIVDNSFNMNLMATAKLNFTYQLYDSNGNLLFEKDYLIEKDREANDEIVVEGGIPNGVLVNKFIFTDGSELNIQTIK